MSRRYSLIIALCISLLTITNDLRVVVTKGSVLYPHERTHLIEWQKQATSLLTPPRVLKTLMRIQQRPQVRTQLRAFKNLSKHTLTWDLLEKRMAQKKSSRFYIFAFGSLINTLSDLNADCQPNINIPGIAFGIKRIYGMTHPQPEHSYIGLPHPKHEHEQLRLDTTITGKKTDYANGILLEFTLETPQYEYLKSREQKYNLVPVKVIDYQSLLKRPRFHDAYILCGTEQHTHADKMPHIAYTTVVIEGAQFIEAQGYSGFLPLLLDTTFLPDGKTTLRSWLLAQ